jgi:mRNA interferase HigB
MRIISRRRLREYWELHPNTESALKLWYSRASDAQWKDFVAVRRVYPSADLVGNLIVFNVAGNNCRVITYIDFTAQIIFIRNVLTHAEYDKENWKNDDWFENS